MPGIRIWEMTPAPCCSRSTSVSGSSVGAPSWTSGPTLLGPELFPGCRPHAPLLGLVAAVAEEVSGSAHRTCWTTRMSCRLPCRACGHRQPRVGTATCPWDTARQVGAGCLEVVRLLGGGGSHAPALGMGRWASPLRRGYKSDGPLAWGKGPI